MLVDIKKPQTMLLCNLAVNEQASEVNETYLRELFSHFGPIAEMVVLRPPPQFRVLLQFCHDSSAKQALNIFGEVTLDVGKMNVIAPSSHQLEQILSALVQSESVLSDLAGKLDDICESHSPQTSLKTTSGVITGDDLQEKRSSENSKSCFDLSDSKDSDHFRVALNPRFNLNLHQSTSKRDFASQPISQSQTESDSCNQMRRPSSNPALIPFEPFLSKTAEQSCLLMITGLNTQRVGAKILMNLCCCFGNVSKLIIDPNSGSAVIRFNSYQEALEAETCLDKRAFFGSLLSVEIVEGRYLQFSRRVATSMTGVQPMHGDYTFYRFQDSLNIKYNPPTNTLHLTNIASGCDQVILFVLISQIREPIRIIKLVQRGKNGSNMYLAVFESSEFAMEVLSVLHNKIIDGKSIKASFSRPRN
jgi:hypothetical protein